MRLSNSTIVHCDREVDPPSGRENRQIAKITGKFLTPPLEPLFLGCASYPPIMLDSNVCSQKLSLHGPPPPQEEIALRKGLCAFCLFMNSTRLSYPHSVFGFLPNERESASNID